VDDETPEVLGAGEKRLSNPEEVMLVLLIERLVGVNAGMHKEAFPIVVKFRKRAHGSENGCGNCVAKELILC
jgi:hypothetical protein